MGGWESRGGAWLGAILCGVGPRRLRCAGPAALQPAWVGSSALHAGVQSTYRPPPTLAAQIEAFFEYYPKRVGQVLFVDAPWVFGPAWEVIRPLMRKYAALVRFVSIKELEGEFFTPDTLPPGFK